MKRKFGFSLIHHYYSIGIRVGKTGSFFSGKLHLGNGKIDLDLWITFLQLISGKTSETPLESWLSTHMTCTTLSYEDKKRSTARSSKYHGQLYESIRYRNAIVAKRNTFDVSTDQSSPWRQSMDGCPWCRRVIAQDKTPFARSDENGKSHLLGLMWNKTQVRSV